MNKIVECVPNFSEGRDMGIIKQITDEIEKVEGAILLDVDPGADTNRTVVTFVGTPEAVKEAAFRAIKKAAELIDMSKHKGAHPRMGATDVCPFVPVSGVTMEDCVQIAKEVGERVARELGIPVYLYEEAATRSERRSLADIRAGEYEGLPEKLKDPEWKPDFGEPVFNPKSGATVIGAREFLIAYNLNVNTRDRKLAHRVALRIREKGRIVKKKDGTKERVPGRLKAVRAIGWYIPEYGYAQISVNLTNYKITPLWKLFEVASEEAEGLGLRITGSELVGLIPKEAMLESGRHFLEKMGKCPAVPEKELIHIAVLSMGMDQTHPFKPEEKIIEYRIAKEKNLTAMRIDDFADELSSESPAPGGGSVAALIGTLSASLSSMVANLTYNKKGYKEFNDEIAAAGIEAQKLKDRFLSLIEEDTEAFNSVMDAMKMPSGTDEEAEAKEKAIEEATKKATSVPLETLKLTEKLLEVANVVVEKGNKNSISDAGVAAISAKAAAESAYMNVIINVPGIKDEEFKENVLKEAKEVLENVRKKSDEIRDKVMKYLEENL
ncbi:glutamate formimidoyltransferase [bacterium]|nr:MAG: glutamate formimidoyltransferase [bacterium]RKZ22436.1 MAG: glutamate formimidoyltransferase [bacterium]